ncbi:M3 family oligoendopeptidase [Tumebacillus sp. DT12]|uniref:M3 family oligoendopeptidase n=1 Tax=Tumebacillus lacus TaxID=2995335 RepID=A0ABT3X6D6_9BACL|nr:M3 family oligoendopeptidase [Tumebacillus lacus]MCX7570304.1 M3 family oligoendopeptidase [Tumebacillus lacus]
MQTLDQNWDLDVLFPGGSESPQFTAHLEELQEMIHALQAGVAALEQQKPDQETWVGLFTRAQDTQRLIKQAMAFCSCLMAQNVKDGKAKIHHGRVQSLYAAYQSAMTQLDKHTLAASDVEWAAVVADERLAAVAFPITERRLIASQKLPTEQEALIGDLSVDGYHAWQSLYNTVIGSISVPFEKDGQPVKLSVGQLQNMYSHPDRDVRVKAFAAWEEAFAEKSDLISTALNHLAGFRVQVYKHRGWESVLKEPLDINRMSQATLDAMWDTVERNKDVLVQYLNRKAKLLGVEKLSYFDQYAPVGEANSKLSYDQGAAFILEHFEKFSPDMAAFAKRAFDERWIEAEDRPGKRPGGFCTSFPQQGQSRIFMTYDGSMSNVATLAHELGHAYHNEVMKDLPPMLQSYAMNVAETASTFAELIVSDAALKQAQSDDERIAMLEDKLQRCVAFFLDIHARFQFENNFYAERKNGLVSVDRLNELMVEAQQKSYKGALDLYHPHFWASKLHFYSTGVPFYNFPYTFGFLFSTGVYARALAEGPEFSKKYVALLRDTGSMTVEDLAQKHLGVDLTQPEFWQSAVDIALGDVEEFLRLTEGK